MMAGRNMKRGMGFAALAAVAVIALLAVSNASGPSAETQGYFKSESNDRVLAFYAQDPLTDAEAREVFSRVTVTPGHPVLAVIYQGAARAPGDRLTGSPDFTTAAALIAAPPFDAWSWRMRVNPAGLQTIDAQD